MAYLSATAEVMRLHVDNRPGAASFPPDRAECIKAVAAAHASAGRPTQAGRGIVQLGLPGDIAADRG